MVRFDLTAAKTTGDPFPSGITIPSDDATYLSKDTVVDYSINQVFKFVIIQYCMSPLLSPFTIITILT